MACGPPFPPLKKISILMLLPCMSGVKHDYFSFIRLTDTFFPIKNDFAKVSWVLHHHLLVGGVCADVGILL